jgi:hypothetical protein
VFFSFVTWAKRKIWKWKCWSLAKLEKPCQLALKIQMRHHKCEKDYLTCPLFHRGYQFLASSIVGSRNIEVLDDIGLNVACLLHVAYAKDMHPARGFKHQVRPFNNASLILLLRIHIH